MTIRAQQTGTFKDEGYPDGMAWRCDCGFIGGPEADEMACPNRGSQLCGSQLWRVARRISWGPLPSQKRDVVVEFR